MTVTIIGCGDAFGSGGRFQTCFAIETAGRRVLVDCGASSLIAMRRTGMDPLAIEAIVLSHLHGDHFGRWCTVRPGKAGQRGVTMR